MRINQNEYPATELVIEFCGFTLRTKLFNTLTGDNELVVVTRDWQKITPEIVGYINEKARAYIATEDVDYAKRMFPGCEIIEEVI